MGLSELLQQPVFAGLGSVLAGQAEVELDFNAAAEYPLQLQAVITDLRARDLPGSSQDYRLAASSNKPAGCLYTRFLICKLALKVALVNIELGCQFYPERQPLPFKLSLASSRVSQSDIELLMASLLTNDTAASANNSALAPRAEETKTQRPPWSDFDGEVSIKLDELAIESGQVLTELKAQINISKHFSQSRILPLQLKVAAFSAKPMLPTTLFRAEPTELHLHSFLNISIPRSFQKKLTVSFQFKGSSMAS